MPRIKKSVCVSCGKTHPLARFDTVAADAFLQKVRPLPPANPPSLSDDDLAVAYVMGDPHVGMMSWAPETGADWDLHVAERTHTRAMASLVEGALPATTAVIVNLGDFFHFDGMEAKTPTSGHFLDADTRYAKVVAAGLRILCSMVATARRKHPKVHIINAAGNHDPSSARFLNEAFKMLYANDPNVTVSEYVGEFHYFRHGRTLLGVHHGHLCKPTQLVQVMATDQPLMWADTAYRYWLTGHVHHESRKEFAGCTVETFGTLAAPDAYAAGGGWRSRRGMCAIAFSSRWGEVCRATVNAEMLA